MPAVIYQIICWQSYWWMTGDQTNLESAASDSSFASLNLKICEFFIIFKFLTKRNDSRRVSRGGGGVSWTRAWTAPISQSQILNLSLNSSDTSNHSRSRTSCRKSYPGLHDTDTLYLSVVRPILSFLSKRM